MSAAFFIDIYYDGLDNIYAMGLRLGFLTNCMEKSLLHVASLKWDELLPNIVVTSDFGSHKVCVLSLRGT